MASPEDQAAEAAATTATPERVKELEDQVTALEAVKATLNDKITQSKAEKIAAPDKYNGTQMKPRAWKTQLNMKFKGNAAKFSTDFEKILYACTYLRGRALDWAESYINGKPGYVFQDLAEFYQRLEDTFGDPNPQATAEQKL